MKRVIHIGAFYVGAGLAGAVVSYVALAGTIEHVSRKFSKTSR